MYRTILVPTDGSTHSRSAISHAAYLATVAEAELIVVSVVNPLSEAVAHILLPIGLPEEHADARGVVAEVASEFRDRGATNVRTLVVDGEAGPRVLEVAAAEDADLIVMSAHGLTGPSRLILGSVAAHVAAHAPCPVLLVR